MRKNDLNKEKKKFIHLKKKKEQSFLKKNLKQKKNNNLYRSNELNKTNKDNKRNIKFKKKNDITNKKNFLSILKIKNSKKFKKNVKNISKKNMLNVKKKINFFKLKKNKKNLYNLNNKNKNFLKQGFNKPKKNIKKIIQIIEDITVFELSNKMGIKNSQVIKKMSESGMNLSKNQILDLDSAQLISEEMGFKVKVIYKNELEKKILIDRDLIKNNIKHVRPPIVTIMGHVDHGKTSLLDCIKKTSLVFKEDGGITQSLGAYHVILKDKKITFLDTPGHSAFTKMRENGAQITDIIVLIIAADDGVMPQTIEAIKHAQSVKVPIIIAINKIDKNNININKIKNELMKYNILSEELGGEHIFVNISVKLKKGINNLLKNILLQSEILDLSVPYKGMATGVVLESFLDKGKGPVSTVIVKEGELKKGDVVLCGLEYGKIRSIIDENKNNLKKITPSIPVEILGLSGLPLSGDILTVVRNEKQAKEVSLYRKNKQQRKIFSKKKKISLENLFQEINKKNVSELNIILKSNSKGSLEAIESSINKLSHNEVNLNILSLGVGSINETDASLAHSSNAIIIGFNVRADISAKKIIEKENIDLRYYSVIYTLIDEIKSSIYGMLSPKYKQKIIGLVSVRSIFKSVKFGFIAGCMVTEGYIKRNSPIKILRNDIVVYEGELESIRRFKEDVKKVRNGIECGVGIKNYNDIRVNDIIEVYKVIEIKRK
ncbi:MAG: translation initiation factor IF-2 [Buchnera aphidicola (Periphyllus acericola)]|uniref:translation initiation factor IF-2 n=1 Tax=Buchnera aphidicola TaxID=9 RepID=UPI0030D3E0B3|nr:translation initiation factor IF-2 [Buchnera aphidicola (Periphyllus acericola)]